MHVPITTTFSIEGYRITAYKGIVRGIIVRSPTIIQGLIGRLKNLIGGQIVAYTEMCEQARQQAYDLMIQHAVQIGANAVVGLRYDASEVVSKGSATEVLCYGTAVVIEPERRGLRRGVIERSSRSPVILSGAKDLPEQMSVRDPRSLRMTVVL